MNAKAKAFMLAGFAAAIMGESTFYNESMPYVKKELTDEEKNEIQRRQREKRGLKPFEIDGKIVWAINRKNAERKAKI